MITFRIIYALLCVILIFIEGIAIGRRKGETISESVWAARATYLIYPMAVLWFWMTGHFFNAVEPDGVIWNDIIYLTIGFFIAEYNHSKILSRHHKSRPMKVR